MSSCKSSKKESCTTDIPMRFLLNILASQNPRLGCLRSHGRCGTTTLTRTVVDVHWQLPSPQNTSKRRQVLQLQCTKDDLWHDCVWLSLSLTTKKKSTCPSATPRLSWRDLCTFQTQAPREPGEIASAFPGAGSWSQYHTGYQIDLARNFG